VNVAQPESVRIAGRYEAEEACSNLENIAFTKGRLLAVGRAAVHLVLPPWTFVEQASGIIAESPFVNAKGELVAQHPWAHFVIQASNNQTGHRQSKVYLLMGDTELRADNATAQHVAFGQRYLIDANERRGPEQQDCPYVVRAQQVLEARPDEAPAKLTGRLLYNLLPQPSAASYPSESLPATKSIRSSTYRKQSYRAT